MDDIAEDVELSKATLYLYFENKISLFFSVVIKGMTLLRNRFQKAAKKEETGLGKVLSIFYAYYDYIQKHADYYRLNLSARSPRFLEQLEKFNKGETKIENAMEYFKLTKQLLDLITEAVKLGIDDGTIRRDLNPSLAVMFISSTIEETVYMSPVNKLLLKIGGSTSKEYLEHSMDILLEGIADEKKKSNS